MTIQNQHSMTPIRENMIVGLGGLIALVLLLEYTLVWPALPHIAATFGDTAIGWVPLMSSLAGVISAPLIGKLGDLYGTKKMILLSCWVFVVGSLLCAAAPSMSVLLTGRFLQGLPLGLIGVLYSVFRSTLSRRGNSKGIAVITAMLGVGWVAGPLIYGLLQAEGGWRNVFWFSAVYMLIVVVLSTIFMKETTVREKSKLDLVGAALLIIGLGSIYGVISMGHKWGWLSMPIIAIALAAVCAMSAFLIRALRIAEPLLDLRVLVSPLVRVPAVIEATATFSQTTLVMLLPLIVLAPLGEQGYGIGASGLQLTLYYVPYALMAFLSGGITGAMFKRGYGVLAMQLGVGCSVVGMCLLAMMHSQSWQLVLGVGIIGLAQSATTSASYLIADGVPNYQRGSATGVSTAFKTCVGGLCVAILTAVLTAYVVSRGDGGRAIYSETAITTGFLLGAVVPIIGVIQSLAYKQPGNHGADTVEGTLGKSVADGPEERSRS